VAGGPIELRIVAEREQYVLQYVLSGGSPVEVARVETRYLSKEVAGGFTGVYFGMYATGNGKRSESAACFDWFDYEPR
jgi:alpha-N-arabinofuranosidase